MAPSKPPTTAAKSTNNNNNRFIIKYSGTITSKPGSKTKRIKYNGSSNERSSITTKKYQGTISSAALKTAATEEKPYPLPYLDSLAKTDSTSASILSRCSNKADGPSKVLKFDIEYKGLSLESKGYLRKLALRLNKVQESNRNGSPLKDKLMMSAILGFKSNKHSASSILSRLIPATLEGDGLHVSTFIKLGTKETKITTHRVGIDSGAWGLWVGPKYLNERSSKLLQKNKMNAEIETITYEFDDNNQLQQELYRDTLSIADMIVQKQEFGVVKEVPRRFFSKGPIGVCFNEGGLGTQPCPPDIREVTEKHRFRKDSNRPTVSVLDNLFSRQMIKKKMLLLCMEPWNTKETDPDKKWINYGTLWFGELSEEQKEGLVFTTSIMGLKNCIDGSTLKLTIEDGPSKLFVDRPGIIDSGTPLIFLKTKILKTYLSKLNLNANLKNTLKSKFDFCIHEQDFPKLNPLLISYTDKSSKRVSFSLSPFAQVLPPTLNDLFNVPKGYLALMVADLGSNDEDVDFLLGAPFLTRFDVAFDITNEMIGMRSNKFAAVEWTGLKWR